MLNKFGLITLGVLSTLFFSQKVHSQTSSSVYSSLGVGDFSYGGLTHNQAMGGLGISYGTGWHANHVNPALSTRNTIFNFQTAFNYKRIDVNNGNERSPVDGGGLSYLAVSLPIKPGKFAAGLGLGQVSSVNYRLNVESQVNNSELRASNFLEGSGGISEAYANFGWLVFKNFSIGLQGSYLFGSTIRTNQLLILDEEDKEVGEGSEYFERLSVSDLGFKAGAHYLLKTSDKSNLHFGAIYQKFGDINGIAFAKLARIGQASDLDSDGDLIANDLRGSIYLPDRYGFGVTYEKNNKYAIGLETQTQDFTQFKNFFGEALDLQKAQKIGLGIQFVPDYLSFDSRWLRSTYRIGVEWKQTPYFFNQTQINDLGINFGTSIPVNQLSLLNLAIQVGQRGTLDNGLIRENYVNFTFGLSLNDNSWFFKRVFE